MEAALPELDRLMRDLFGPNYQSGRVGYGDAAKKGKVHAIRKTYRRHYDREADSYGPPRHEGWRTACGKDGRRTAVDPTDQPEPITCGHCLRRA